MHTQQKLQGAVILPYDKPHAHEVIELLTLRLRDRFDPVFYTHAGEIDSSRHHDFIIVLSRKSLEGAVQVMRAKKLPMPLVIHIDEPDVVQAINYATLFPGIEVAAIEQANFSGDPDITLKIMLFKEIIERLEARQNTGRRRFM